MSRSDPVSAPRSWWVEKMSPVDRRSHLLVSHLEGLATLRGHDESAVIRRFLANWRSATIAGNQRKLSLMVRVLPKRANCAVIFAVIPGVKHADWIPTITVPWHAKFDQIMRECGERPMFVEKPERKTDVWGQPERPRKPPVLSKVNIELLSI